MNTTLSRRMGVFALIVAVAIPVIATAATFQVGEQVSTDASKITAGDLYLAGGNVTTAGTVTGDLTAAGGSVVINGAIGSDLLVVGGNVTIAGSVGDDLRIGGGTVVVSGSVGGDVMSVGGQLTLAGTRIGGDVVAAGGQIRIDAPVSGNVWLSGGDVRLNAPITGNVTIKSERLTLGEGVVISGSLTYQSREEAVMMTGAKVIGETKYTPWPASKGSIQAAFATLLSLAFLARFAMFFVTSLLFAFFFKRYTKEMSHAVLTNPFTELGRGAVTLIVLPVISIILFVTIIGIPLGLFSLLAFAAFMLIAPIAAPVVAAAFLQKWMKKNEHPTITWQWILLGSLVFSLLSVIPLIGWMLKAALCLMTVGSITALKWRVVKEWR